VLRELHQAEAQLLADAAAQIALWQQALHNDRPMLSPASSATALQDSIDRVRDAERKLLQESNLPAALDSPRQRQLARRLLLCYQIAAVVQRMQARWMELMQQGSALRPAPKA